MVDFGRLDNPVWSALEQRHRSIARSTGLAARYLKDVSPFAALREPTPKAFADLRTLVPPGEFVGLVTADGIAIPDDWQTVAHRFIDQMVWGAAAPSAGIALPALGDADVADMLALTTLTEPGPVPAGTIRMGSYFGIWSSDGTLAAMAGERMKPEGFTEISTVCTHPDHRGKGYARTLVEAAAARIFDDGRVPFLHVKTENGAKILYEKLGFSVRAKVHFTVIALR